MFVPCDFRRRHTVSYKNITRGPRAWHSADRKGSNSNETCWLTVTFWTLTYVTFKSRSNQKPGYYVMYTYYIYLWQQFGADPAISWGVIALCFFSKLATWQPYLKSDQVEIWLKGRWCLVDPCSCSRSNSNETCQYWCCFDYIDLCDL
jgi:hypothetical protein